MPSSFFNDTAPTAIYTLSLHDALPICRCFESAATGLQHQHALALALQQHGQQQGHRATADDDDVVRCVGWRGMVQVDDHEVVLFERRRRTARVAGSQTRASPSNMAP